MGVVELLCVLGAVVLGVAGVRWKRSRRRRKFSGVAIVSAAVLTWLAGLSHALRCGGVAWVYVIAVGYVLVLLWLFLLLVVCCGRRANNGSLQAVVVLGAGLLGTNVTPSLAGRLDKGVAVARASGAQVVVCSGGKGSDEVISEAEAMSRYIVTRAPNDFDVVKEDCSTTTEENLRFSAPIIRRVVGADAQVGIVSSDYHVLRARVLARRLGLPWNVYGAPTAVFSLPIAVVREFVALLIMTWYWHVFAVGAIGMVAILL